jgi:crotonobetainyl-CoA:carnitine CoA-transferase CaiB-like acyl-CoA transferase
VAHYFEQGRRPGRIGNRNPYLTPAEAYPTRDGFVTVVLMSPDQWERFCRALGDLDLALDARFSTNADRLAGYEELRRRIEARTVTATTGEWVERFEAASIAAGPIYEFDQVFEDPQVRHLGLVAEADQPGHGPVRMLGLPFRASATGFAIRRPAPRLGEHTEEVLAELGLAAADIERLAAAGAIALAGTAPSPAVSRASST